jgi:hypothetical protein
MKAFSYSLSQKKGKKIRNAVIDKNPYLKATTLVNSKYTNFSGIKIVKNTDSLKKLEQTQSTKIESPCNYFDVKSMIINSMQLLNYIYPLQPELDGEIQILKLNIKSSTDTIIHKNIISSTLTDVDLNTFNTLNIFNNMEFNISAIDNKLLHYFNSIDHNVNLENSTQRDDFMKINNFIISNEFFVGNMSAKNLSDESIILNVTPSNKLNMISTNSGTIDNIINFHEDMSFETNVGVNDIPNKFISNIHQNNQNMNDYQSPNLELNLHTNATNLNKLFDNLSSLEILGGDFNHDQQEKEKEKEREQEQDREREQEKELILNNKRDEELSISVIGNMFNGIRKNTEFMKMVSTPNEIIRVEEINTKNILFEKNIDSNNNPNNFFSNIRDTNKRKPTSTNLELNMNNTPTISDDLFTNPLSNSSGPLTGQFNKYLFIENVTNNSESIEDITKINKISSNKLAIGTFDTEIVGGIKLPSKNLLFENIANDNTTQLFSMNGNIDIIKNEYKDEQFQSPFNNIQIKPISMNENMINDESLSINENIHIIKTFTENVSHDDTINDDELKSTNDYINIIKPPVENLLFETPFNNVSSKIFPINNDIGLNTMQMTKALNLKLSETNFDDAKNQIIQDALKSLREKCKRIVNVYQLVYNSNVHASGFGDFIRGSYFLMEFCKKYDFKCSIDISNHPIKKCLKKYSNIQLSEIQSNIYKKIDTFQINNFSPIIDANRIITNNSTTDDKFNDFLIYLNTQQNVNGNIYVYDINYPTESYSHIFKRQMQEILEPTNRIKIYVDIKLKSLNLHAHSFEVIHIRCGDDYFGKNIKCGTLNLKFIFHELDKLNPNKKYLIISDNTYFKELIKNKYNFVNILNHNIVHTAGDDVKIKDLENTMLDFYLMSKSNNLMSYSAYTHGSGFSKWCAYTYNIPYFCKYFGKI